MIKFKMFCPDCGAKVITSTPQAVIWELCPGCRAHIWDMSDVMMADLVSDRAHGDNVRSGTSTQ